MPPRIPRSSDSAGAAHPPYPPYPVVLCQANGIVNVGNETRIYHGRWRNAPDERYYGEIALATLPRDRWGALGLFPGTRQGSVWTAPVTLPETACTVSLNAEGVSGMHVEIADERFNLLPPFSGENSGLLPGADGLACPVHWPAGSLAALANQTVRFRVHLQQQGTMEPRLYAVYLNGG